MWFFAVRSVIEYIWWFVGGAVLRPEPEINERGEPSFPYAAETQAAQDCEPKGVLLPGIQQRVGTATAAPCAGTDRGMNEHVATSVGARKVDQIAATVTIAIERQQIPCRDD